MSDHLPRVVIVGGGFGGLATAKALKNTPAHITVVDRTNHHLFQPLLYQVATSVLTPGQIASPIRGILRNQSNVTVILAEISGVDKERRCVFANSADREGIPLPYDYLILATGVRHSYFGRDEFEKHAPGLKSLADAVAIRNKVLQTFEQAEAEDDPGRHRELLTFVLVGAGPTGVEMAGAIAALVRGALRSEFRRIDPTSARIILVDRGSRVLGSFCEELSDAAKARLEELGVDVRQGRAVEQIDEDGVIVGGERIPSKTVIWTAGVAPSPAGKWLGVETDHAGRVRIQNDLTVPGHPEIFVVGDTASLEQDGQPLPGVAQVAMQQGRYAGKLIHSRITGSSTPAPFRYFDKGSMAVVGKGFAILQTGRLRLSGFLAWLAWAAVHLEFLAQSSLRVSVFIQWVWTYLTGQRGSLLIVDHHGLEVARPRPSAPATNKLLFQASEHLQRQRQSNEETGIASVALEQRLHLTAPASPIMRIWSWSRIWLRNLTLDHSARTAVAAVVSLLVARFSGLPEAYWAAITTLIVMQSVLGTSLPIAGRQFSGAALGAALGGILATRVRPSAWTFGAGIFLLGLICAALGRAHKRLHEHLDRTAYRYAGVTLAIVMLITRSQSAWVAAAHRFLEVSIGIVVALAMTVLWPERSVDPRAALAPEISKAKNVTATEKAL